MYSVVVASAGQGKRQAAQGSGRHCQQMHALAAVAVHSMTTLSLYGASSMVSSAMAPPAHSDQLAGMKGIRKGISPSAVPPRGGNTRDRADQRHGARCFPAPALQTIGTRRRSMSPAGTLVKPCAGCVGFIPPVHVTHRQLSSGGPTEAACDVILVDKPLEPAGADAAIRGVGGGCRQVPGTGGGRAAVGAGVVCARRHL